MLLVDLLVGILVVLVANVLLFSVVYLVFWFVYPRCLLCVFTNRFLALVSLVFGVPLVSVWLFCVWDLFVFDLVGFGILLCLDDLHLMFSGFVCFGWLLVFGCVFSFEWFNFVCFVVWVFGCWFCLLVLLFVCRLILLCLCSVIAILRDWYFH